jgi:hypothetical protein
LLCPLLPLPEVVVGAYVVEPQEYEPDVLPELVPQELELDAVCCPWKDVRIGRLEGTWKSG